MIETHSQQGVKLYDIQGLVDLLPDENDFMSKDYLNFPNPPNLKKGRYKLIPLKGINGIAIEPPPYDVWGSLKPDKPYITISNGGLGDNEKKFLEITSSKINSDDESLEGILKLLDLKGSNKLKKLKPVEPGILRDIFEEVKGKYPSVEVGFEDYRLISSEGSEGMLINVDTYGELLVIMCEKGKDAYNSYKKLLEKRLKDVQNVLGEFGKGWTLID